MKFDLPIGAEVYTPPVRVVVPVPCRLIDQHIETVQNQSDSVQKLFQDYVLGKLDPRQLAGGSYDPEDSDEVDDFNHFGLELEDVTRIQDRGKAASEEIKRKQSEPEPASTPEPPSPPDPNPNPNN